MMFNFLKKKPTDMFLIVGLGNPGKKYEGNRHNAGFMAVDAIAKAHGFSSYRGKFQGQFCEGSIGEHKVSLLKPETYMNESGQAVKKATKFYKIPPSRVIVLHDELDIKPAEVKVKAGGGNAGHNGLKSIQSHLGTPDFLRVRIGIGHPGEKNRVSGYVLSDFGKAECEAIDGVCERIADNISALLHGDEKPFIQAVKG